MIKYVLKEENYMEDLQNMKRIGFNDINNKIDILFKDRPEYIFGSFSKTSITPQISSFKIKKNDNKNICSLDDRNKIRNLFINNSFSKENEIDKNLYISISNFMLGINIPEEKKKIVSEFLTDDIKEYIFNDFFEITEKTNKSFTNDTGLFLDDNNEIIDCPFKYNPIINGIPLKDFESDKKWIGSKKLYDIIESGIIPDNTFEAVALKSFVESYDLTNKQWCPEKLKNFKQQFEDEKVKEKIDNWIKQLDKEKISFLKNADFVEHSVKMNEKIKEKLINDVPQDFNQMEKSMYLYIKLCQIFSYDDDYYKNNNTEKKRKDI